jgi:glycosyltransferase involved in cell wall biosynthesis
MSRLQLISHSATQSGAPLILLRLAEWLKANSKFELDFVVRDQGLLSSEFEKIGNVHVPTLGKTKPLNRIAKLATRVRRITGRPVSNISSVPVSTQHYDLVYSNTITNGDILEHLQPRVPVITHVHELEYWIEKCGARNLELVKIHTSHFIAASYAVRDVLVNSYDINPEKISVVHEFVRPATFDPSTPRTSIREQLGLTNEDYVVVASGWEFWRKGRDLVPQLMCQINRLMPEKPVHFLWVGNYGTSDEEALLRSDLIKSGQDRYFHQTGHVTNADDYFASGDVFALLSRDDAFPLVCLEAASLRLPVVCFKDAGGMPEFVEHDCGRVVPYLDLRAMAEAIVDLMKNRELRMQLGETGRRKVVQSFTVQVAAPKILTIINKLISGEAIPLTREFEDANCITPQRDTHNLNKAIGEDACSQ